MVKVLDTDRSQSHHNANVTDFKELENESDEYSEPENEHYINTQGDESLV